MSFLMLKNTIIPKDYINTLSWVLSLPTKEALNLPPLQCHRKVCTSVGISINRRLFKIAFFSILPKIKGGKLPPYPSGIRRPCHWVRGRVWGETLITVISATILQNLAFEAHLDSSTMHTYNIHNMHGGVSLIPGHLSIIMIFCPIKNHAHI